MIQVSHLTKTYRSPLKSGSFLRDFFARTYKTHTAVHDISFEIGDGELVGFIGPNGAGKTTTMKMLAGILYPSGGNINVNGFVPFEKKREYLSQISFIMGQKNQMLWELPAIDTFAFIKVIYQISDASYRRRLHNLTDLLADETMITKPVKTLSLGQRMRVELIASLLHEPKVLYLDEPTIGLDIFAQSTIIQCIRAYQNRYKPTIILTSHNMQDVERLASRVILIDHGHIIYDGGLSHLVQRTSTEKTITLTCVQVPDLSHLGISFPYSHSYESPRLKVTVSKIHLQQMLDALLEKIEYSDVSIENEPLEEVIKKQFNQISS